MWVSGGNNILRGCGMNTLPMMARPKPPLGAHSSLQTRSSLPALPPPVTARETVVTRWPRWSSVWRLLSECQRFVGDEDVAHMEPVQRAPRVEEVGLTRVVGGPREDIHTEGHVEK